MKWLDMDSIWPGIYWKPTRTDLVLDAIVGVLVLAIWGIVLEAFFIPAWFPGTIERELVVKSMLYTILFSVLYFGMTRYPRQFLRRKTFNIFGLNPQDKSERQFRIEVRCGRLGAIAICLFLLWESVKIVFALMETKWLDDVFRFSLVAIVVSLAFWRTTKQ